MSAGTIYVLRVSDRKKPHLLLQPRSVYSHLPPGQSSVTILLEGLRSGIAVFVSVVVYVHVGDFEGDQGLLRIDMGSQYVGFRCFHQEPAVVERGRF